MCSRRHNRVPGDSRDRFHGFPSREPATSFSANSSAPDVPSVQFRRGGYLPSRSKAHGRTEPTRRVLEELKGLGDLSFEEQTQSSALSMVGVIPSPHCPLISLADLQTGNPVVSVSGTCGRGSPRLSPARNLKVGWNGRRAVRFRPLGGRASFQQTTEREHLPVSLLQAPLSSLAAAREARPTHFREQEA